MPRKTTSDTAARTVALCYLRKSVVRGDAEYGSVEQQRAAVAKIVDERGWRAEWYEDAEGHRSGRKEKGRPRWLALRSRIGDADVAAVVAHRMERLSRSVRDFGDLIEFCARRMSRFAIYAEVRSLGRDAGIPNLSPHDCRVYWALWHWNKYRDLHKLMHDGGWSSPAMPLRYTERAEEAKG